MAGSLLMIINRTVNVSSAGGISYFEALAPASVSYPAVDCAILTPLCPTLQWCGRIAAACSGSCYRHTLWLRKLMRFARPPLQDLRRLLQTLFPMIEN